MEKKLKTYVRKLKVRVSNLQLDNDRLRRKVDMLTVQNNELLKNEPTSDNKQNQQKHPLSLNSPIFIPKNKNQTNNSYNQKKNVNNHIDVSSSKLSFEDKSDIKVLNQLNNLGSDKSSKNFNTFQKTTDGVKNCFQKTTDGVKNCFQKTTDGVKNCFQNVVIKNVKKTTDDNGFHFDKKINSWLNIESTCTELEKMKNVIPGKQRSFSEKLKDMKSNPKHTTNKVPSMIAEYEKF